MARLLRHKAQPAVLDVLTAQSHDVAAAYPQIKQEGKREPRLGADGMPSLELSDLINRPGVKSRCGVTDLAHLARWIEPKEVALHSPAKHRREILAAVVRGRRF